MPTIQFPFIFPFLIQTIPFTPSGIAGSNKIYFQLPLVFLQVAVMESLTGFGISNVLSYFGLIDDTKDLMHNLCKRTRDLHLEFGEAIYFDVVSVTYAFSKN